MWREGYGIYSVYRCSNSCEQCWYATEVLIGANSRWLQRS